MTKASRLVEQLEAQLEKAQANIIKKNARLIELSEKLRELGDKVKKMEAENADLKRQVTEAVSYILSNEGASMIDCRICFFESSCEREPKQCAPNRDMCERAIRKTIEEAGE